MRVRPELGADAVGTGVEVTVRVAVFVSVNRFPEVVRTRNSFDAWYDPWTRRTAGNYSRLPIILSRLPQKQGLCQVVNRSDFGMLSDF